MKILARDCTYLAYTRVKKIDGACCPRTRGRLRLCHCVSGTPRPNLRPPESLSQSFLKKFFQLLNSLKKNIVLSLVVQAALLRSKSRSRIKCCFASTCGRVFTERSWAADWSQRGSRRAVATSPYRPPPPAVPRDVGSGPRWWKLAASRARVVGCRSRGLGLHLPTLPF
ncbi:hypothetical protein RR46_06035 [Papilio xuthus]|uniref:Uncharacterized protein n=1 Tax=Papilio xuthus TaxID=66420 RepID=A0A194Q8L3_PAPXU|nr:hypothetical protein RR46_06035 [Papilio xuthus]